ncbi:glycosyltransferase [Bacillus sp. AK128]
MKKKLLFVIDSLHCAGAEKSLVTLLSLLDFSRYNVDLMLFTYGGVLEELVPTEVNILGPLEYTEYTKLSLKESVIQAIRNKSKIKLLLSRLRYSSTIRLGKYGNPEKARFFWKSTSGVIEVNPKEYDVAISYAQGIPTFYVAEKVKAIKKIAWVNASYSLDKRDKIFQKNYYDMFEKIVVVSESAKDIFKETFPEYKTKVEVIFDIINPDFIYKMADLDISQESQFEGIKILTIGRFDYPKGYDIALAACKLLKEHGVNFKWYVLGNGPLERQIEEYIRKNNLTGYFELLGVKPNPYPYIKASDIYVQTSRTEGFGLAIAEARMLNTPVVTTRFDAVYNQMVDQKNGLVVNMDAESVFEGIMKFINDSDLYNRVVSYLKEEKKGNLDEVEKIYKLIG